MVEQLVIVGAGGTGRTLTWVVDELNRQRAQWTVVGFLDDDAGLAGQLVGGVPILGAISRASEYADCRFIVSVASYTQRGARARLVQTLNMKKERFATLVHPSAHVAPGAHVEPGCIVLHNAVVEPEAQLGAHVIVSRLATVGHDAVLADGVTLAAGALVCGSARVEAGAYIGAGAVVRDGVTIGAGALVGVGAVVTSDVDPAVTVLGNPARSLARRRG